MDVDIVDRIIGAIAALQVEAERLALVVRQVDQNIDALRAAPFHVNWDTMEEAHLLQHL